MEFNLPRLTIPVTLKCNLRCKHCINELQYFEASEDLTIESFKKDLKRFFDLIDRVGKFEFTGGEPFLRRDLPQFVKEAAKHRNRFDFMRIDTNGSISVNPELVEAMKPNIDVIEVFTSHYGGLSKYADENADCFERNGIRHIERKYYGDDMYFGGWVDNGIIASRGRDKAGIERVYRECEVYKGLKGCWLLLNGQLHLCARSLQGTIHSAFESLEGRDYVNIHADRSMEETRKAINNLCYGKGIHACNYCDGALGTADDSKRFTPAEQLGDIQL